MDEFLKRIEEIKKQKGADLSMEEDLSIAVMNLISLEEHFYFTAKKTKKDEYLKYVEEIREMRKKLLARMIPVNEGETWCISKHLLAASYRMMEVATKFQNLKDEKLAKEAFDDAYKLFNYFWGIRLKLIDLSKLEETAKEEKKLPSDDKPWSMDDIMSKLVDCCRE